MLPGTLLRSATYRLDYALGRGSFGITYAAHHTSLDEVFAIKEFYPIEFALRDQTNQSVIVPQQAVHAYQRSLHRFIEEARILAKLSHPNVVRVYDMFEAHNTAYMVMDLIEGKTLTQILKAQPGRKLPLPKVEFLIEQIVDALSAIHHSGIYHLDLKPENLILTADNKVHLIDFGAARQVANARRVDTRLFTEQYAAPEIITGGELGPESDLFELGMLLYQIITGKLPPPAMKRLSGEVGWEPDGLIPPWEQLVNQALQLKREERPRSVREWWLSRHRVTQGPGGLWPIANLGATELKGTFRLPDLAQERLQQRLGRGKLIQVIPLSEVLVVAIAASGATLFDLTTGQLLWEIDNPVTLGTVTPDQQLLVLVHRIWVYVWELGKGKLLQQFQAKEQPITGIAVTSHLGFFIHQKSTIVTVWELRTGYAKPIFESNQGIFTKIAVSSQGDYLALGTQDGVVCFWDVLKHQEMACLQGHSQAITSLGFSSHQDILASGSRDNTIQLWSIPSGQPIQRLKGHLDRVTHLCFSGDGRRLASAAGIDDKSIRVWDLTQFQEIQRLQGHWNTIQSIQFDPKSRYLISSSYDATIRSWYIAEGHYRHQLKRHSNWIYGVACSPNGEFIATATNEPTIHVWHRLQQRRINLLIGHRDRVTSVAFSPDGRYLLSGSVDQSLRLWDMAYGTILRVFSGHQDWITAVAISPNNQYLASGGWEKVVRLWAIADGDNALKVGWQFLRGNKPNRLLQGHQDHITSLAFSPNSHLLATGSKDQTLRIWEVASGQEVHQCLGHRHHVRCVAFSPDGQFVASGSWDSTVRLWHVPTGKEMKPAFEHPDYINAIAYSQDGHYLAAGSRNSRIYIWNLLTGQEHKCLEGHTHSINSLTFHGQILIAGDQDGIVRCWQI